MVSEPPQCCRTCRVLLGYPWSMCWGEGDILSDLSERACTLKRVRCDFPYCMFCVLGYGGFWDDLICFALDVL